MNAIISYVSSQFRNPKGLGGRIISIVQNVVNRKMYSNAVSLVDARAEDKLLDIGYGNGNLIRMLYDKTGADMYGIDISDTARKLAEERNTRAMADGKLYLATGDCCSLPYGDDFFNTVTTINTVYFWSDTVKGLSEIRRVLKSGGRFINIVYTREYLDTVKYTRTGYKKFNKTELIDAGKKAGFSDIEIVEIEKGKSFAVICSK